MKNIEKYRDEIINFKGDSFCKDFIRPVILKKYRRECVGTGCENCRLIQTIWANEEYEEPERPELTPEELENLPVDTLLEVWNDESEEWRPLRYFAKYEDDKIYCWDDGCTSKTMDVVCDWGHARLAE